MNLVFLLDSSGSIGEKGFDQSRMFLKKLIDLLPLGHVQDGDKIMSTLVSIVQFSDEGKESVELPLVDGTKFEKVEHAVNTMKWHVNKFGGDPMTHTAEALEYVLENVFPPPVPDSGIADVLFLITDGQANGKKDPAAVAAKARESGIEIVAIGIAEYNEEELKKVTGDDEKVFLVNSHKDLLSIMKNTTDAVCEEPNKV